jgi:hypothetical protein
MSEIPGGNVASFKTSAENRNRPAMKRTCSTSARLSHSPAVPVAVMMVVMPVMVPAMPPMMMMVVEAVMSPMHFRRRQPGILLNRRGSAGIAQG